MSLTASEISFSYGSRFSLAGASIDAGNGELVGVIGPNGSGKTTLLKILSGLLPHTAGSISLDRQPLRSFSPNRRARHLAYVPQSHRPAFEFTVEQVVLLGRMPYRGSRGGFETDRDIAAADETIALLELESLRHEPITRLSGGELQRAMIAKALAQETGTLVLDEPNTHLDISHQQSVLGILRRRIRERSLSVIASIHDLNLASMFCDSLVIMAGGRTLRQGSPREVLTEARLCDTFGIRLDIEPGVYGDSPAVRYREQGVGDAR